MSSHPINLPSLCIPRVFPNIDEKRIRRIFNDLALGEIDRIDIVAKTTEKGEKFNRIFVHFRRWHTNQDAVTARERLLNGKEIKIVYDDPWFWKVSAYRPPVAAAPKAPAAKVSRKPRIQFDDEQQQQRPEQQQQRPEQQQQRPEQQQQRPEQPQPKLAPRLALPVQKRKFVAKKTLKLELEEGEIDEK